jgi:hypothetical protein
MCIVHLMGVLGQIGMWGHGTVTAVKSCLLLFYELFRILYFSAEVLRIQEIGNFGARQICIRCLFRVRV